MKHHRHTFIGWAICKRRPCFAALMERNRQQRAEAHQLLLAELHARADAAELYAEGFARITRQNDAH